MKNKKNGWGRNKRWLLFIASIFLITGLWQLVTNLFQEEEKELRSQLRKTIKETFPAQTEEFIKTIGLFFYELDPTAPREAALDRKSVVLIHGLDEPGKVWQSLAPALEKEGFNVWLMRYPNDQPIVESARLFFAALQDLKQTGVNRISIVGHSMGGLVSREMLTRPEINYDTFVQSGRVPAVASLIMVGTPNHGSQLARMRVFTELRDQLGRLTKGEARWLYGILDGAGEAKIDLLPGSRFLTELNSRSHPVGLEMLIIAGILSPWSEDDINRWMRESHQELSDNKQKWINELGSYMIAMTHGLGDGLVTVESTRLKGVSHQIVSGTHLSMIRNVSPISQRIPPAVPLIIERLKRQSL